MVPATKVLRFLGLMLLSVFVLTACGDNTATSTSVPAATAATTAATTTSATTSIATTAATTSGAAGTTSAASGANAATDVQAGLQIFTQNCQSCHLQGGKAAGTGPKLAGERELANANRIQRQIRNGGGGMPAFSPNQISDTDLTKLIAYLKTLQ